MNNNISLIQNQQLLNEKNKKLKPNSNSLKIENLINKLDKLIIDFNTDLETYSNYRIIIQDKINEFKQKNNKSRNVYVGKLPTIDHTFLGCYKNSNSMSYIGDNMSFENCKTSPIPCSEVTKIDEFFRFSPFHKFIFSKFLFFCILPLSSYKSQPFSYSPSTK